MSKLSIKYTDDSIVKKDVTGVETSVTKHFLKIKITDKRTQYIPLCNIKEIAIDGVKDIKE